MRAVMLFIAGLAVGLMARSVIAQTPAQTPNTGVRMMNHVAVNVADVPEAIKYYSDKMGFREAFRSYDAEGRLRFVYLQISKETFLELSTASAERPAGRVRHYGLWVDDAKKTVDMLRQRGVKVSDATLGTHRPTPGVEMTGAVIALVDDPYMGEIEIIQISPQQQRAIASWTGPS